MVNFSSYQYQGLFAFLLSFGGGLAGRCLLTPADPKKSFLVSLVVTTLKGVALAVFVWWGMWLSVSFTALLVGVWGWRSWKYWVLWRRVKEGSLGALGGYNELAS